MQLGGMASYTTTSSSKSSNVSMPLGSHSTAATAKEIQVESDARYSRINEQKAAKWTWLHLCSASSACSSRSLAFDSFCTFQVALPTAGQLSTKPQPGGQENQKERNLLQQKWIPAGLIQASLYIFVHNHKAIFSWKCKGSRTEGEASAGS